MNFKQVKWVSTVSNTNNFFLKLLMMIIIPLILVLFLVLLFFAPIIRVWQKLTASRAELEKEKEDRAILQSQPWTFFASVNNLEIECKLAGSLRWDSGDYYYLDSDPTIPYLQDHIFGDWFHIDFNGIFLQKFIDDHSVNCDLIFIGADTLQVLKLQNDIPSKNWEAKKSGSGDIEFTFITDDGNFIYKTGDPAGHEV